MSVVDQSTKHFNTAIIATKIPKETNFSARLDTAVKTPAFLCILQTIQNYANQSGKPEEVAAEEIIQTFRELDKLWNDFIFQEGLEKLKKQLSR